MDKFLNRTTKENIEGTSPKRKRETSCVWQHFKKTEDKTKATCIHCGKTFKTAGNTTNLMDHLKRIHPNYSVLEIDGQSPSLDSLMQRNMEYESQKKKTTEKYVMLMIARDVQPFSMVEDDGFRNLMQHMDPKYKIPSRTFFREVMLPKIYKDLRKDLECELEGVQYVAITTDGWTSRANEAYITVTCHFVNKKFQLITAVLSTASLLTPTNHSALNIADTIRQVLN
nr:zinc finger BED domain-containing protein 4-like [Drosophila bipectinata]